MEGSPHCNFTDRAIKTRESSVETDIRSESSIVIKNHPVEWESPKVPHKKEPSLSPSVLSIRRMKSSVKTRESSEENSSKRDILKNDNIMNSPDDILFKAVKKKKKQSKHSVTDSTDGNSEMNGSMIIIDDEIYNAHMQRQLDSNTTLDESITDTPKKKKKKKKHKSQNSGVISVSDSDSTIYGGKKCKKERIDFDIDLKNDLETVREDFKTTIKNKGKKKGDNNENVTNELDWIVDSNEKDFIKEKKKKKRKNTINSINIADDSEIADENYTTNTTEASAEAYKVENITHNESLLEILEEHNQSLEENENSSRKKKRKRKDDISKVQKNDIIDSSASIDNLEDTVENSEVKKKKRKNRINSINIADDREIADENHTTNTTEASTEAYKVENITDNESLLEILEEHNQSLEENENSSRIKKRKRKDDISKAQKNEIIDSSAGIDNLEEVKKKKRKIIAEETEMVNESTENKQLVDTSLNKHKITNSKDIKKCKKDASEKRNKDEKVTDSDYESSESVNRSLSSDAESDVCGKNDERSSQLRDIALLKVAKPEDTSVLHEMLTGKTITSSKLETLRLGGLSIKSGKFTKDEDRIIKKNWKRFVKEYNVPDQPELFFCLVLKKKPIMRYKSILHFKQYLSQGLPTRTITSVYNRFKRLYSDTVYKQGRFTPEEDEIILTYIKSKKNKPNFCKILGKKLGRPNPAIEKRISLLKKNATVDEIVTWNNSNMAKLIKKMLKVTKCSDYKELENRELTTQEWIKLGKKLDFPVPRLKRGWYETVYPRLFIKKNSVDMKKMCKSLIKRMSERGENDWRAVDWRYYSSLYEGFTHQKIYQQLSNLVKYRVPKSKQKDLGAALRLLSNSDFQFRKKRIEKVAYVDGKIVNLSKESMSDDNSK